MSDTDKRILEQASCFTRPQPQSTSHGGRFNREIVNQPGKNGQYFRLTAQRRSDTPRTAEVHADTISIAPHYNRKGDLYRK